MQRKTFTEQLLALPAEKRKNIEKLLHSPQPQAALWRHNLDALWEQFSDLADENFISEFARKPNDRAWEMQLGAALSEAGFKLEARKPGPDFLTYDGEHRVWIEAVVAEAGKGADSVPEAPFMTVINAPEDKIVLRITNALGRKIKQLEKHIAAGIIEDSDRYVIALCTNAPKQLVNSYHVVRAVYGIGGWEFDHSANTNEVVGGWLVSKREINKANGATVSTDAFLIPAWGRVSALLYTNGPKVEDLLQPGREFATVHNYAARFPLRWGWLRFQAEFRMEEVEIAPRLVRCYGRGVRLPAADM